MKARRILLSSIKSCRGVSPPPLVAAALLVLTIAAGTAHAAVDTEERWVWYDDLVPYSDYKYGHEYFYQVPESPRGIALFFHGCVGSGSNYWPQSKACPSCRGLPEQMSHTLQALRRGMAVLAISSGDRSTGCWSWNGDGGDVASLVPAWMNDWGLKGLPIYGMGISSGGSFVLKLPRYLKMQGILSEALAIDPATWGLNEVGVYPPTVFINMVIDENQQERYKQNVDALQKRGSPVEMIKVWSRRVYPTYFSDRSPYYITPEYSREIANALHKMWMIDEEGWVTEDPRASQRPWLKELQTLVPALGGNTQNFNGRTVPKFFDASADVNSAGIYSLMNLAYAKHEIISDYFTAALMWFESGGSSDFQSLLDGYTYGWPPEEMVNHVYGASPPPPPPSPTPPSPLPPHPSPPPPSSPSPAFPPTSSDEQLLRLAQDAAVALAPVPQSGTWDSISASLAASPGPAPMEQSTGGSSTNLAAIIGGVVGGVVGGVLAAGLLFFFVRRRRSNARGSGSIHHTGPTSAAGAEAKLSIVPGVEKRFDLTEVVEASGSPHSARRRARTAFNSSGSPVTRSRSPQKRGHAAT